MFTRARPSTRSRAVFLSLILFISIIGSSAIFITPTGAAINADDLDGTAVWQGQVQNVDLSGTTVGENEETISIREVTGTDAGDVTDTSAAMTRTTNEDGILEIRTAQLDESTYVLRFNGEFLIDGDFTGSLGDNLDTLEVIIHKLNVEFSDNEVEDEDTVEIVIDSNRASFDLNVSETGELLPGSDLESIFAGYEGTIETGGGYIILKSTSDYEEFDIDTTEISGGDYEFLFEVEDTHAEASESLTILAPVDPIEDDSNLTYTFDIPNDGDTYSIAFPGEVEGSLADIFDTTDTGYSIYKFDDGEWEQVTDFAGVDPDPLDAYAISTENASGQPDSFSIAFEFEPQPATTIPPQADLTEGWNVVGAPKFADADTVFGLDDAFLVLDPFAEPVQGNAQEVSSFKHHYIGDDSNQVSPFKGYYLYVEDDTALPGVMSGYENRTEIVQQLEIDPYE